MLMLLTMTVVAFAADSALTGSGTETDPYVVTDYDGLKELWGNPGAYDGKYIVLGQDIEFTARQRLTSIGGIGSAPFKGHFDGCGYAIKNITRILPVNNAGLFGYAVNATIKNLKIESANYSCSGYECVGAVVGYAEDSTISGIKVVGCTIEANAAVGGIAGKVKNCEIRDCRSLMNQTVGSISSLSGENAGGIVGQAENSSVYACINNVPVSNKSKNCGGIAGSISGTVSHCLNVGTVSSKASVSGERAGAAGIAGVASGTVSYCGNGGTVNSITNCSGIVDSANKLTVSYCYNAVSIAPQANFLNSSYAIAPSSATISNCVSQGDMTKKETFVGWDFDTVWFEPADYHGYVYPVLRDCSFHTLDITETEATCTSAGYKNYVCTGKNADNTPCTFNAQELTSPQREHDWVISRREEASCIENGEITYKCSVCQVEKPEKDVIPKDPEKHVDEDHDGICDLCQQEINKQEVKKSFFKRIGDFFRRIFEWIRNLFKKKS